jgi:hypothetical protein
MASYQSISEETIAIRVLYYILLILEPARSSRGSYPRAAKPSILWP